MYNSAAAAAAAGDSRVTDLYVARLQHRSVSKASVHMEEVGRGFLMAIW